MPDIAEALLALDPDNSEHWTDQGLPSMEAIKAIVGDSSITRRDVNDVDANYNREAAHSAQAVEPGAEPPEAPPATDDSGAGDPAVEALRAAEAAAHAAQEAADRANAELAAAMASLETEKDRNPTAARRWTFQDSMRHLQRRQEEERARVAAAAIEAAKRPVSQFGPSELDRALSGRARVIPPHPAVAPKGN